MNAKQLYQTLNNSLFPSFQQYQSLNSFPQQIKQKIGNIIDSLLQYEYFSSLSHLYGRQYLIKLITFNLLQGYILRKNMKLIDQYHIYVLIEGKLNKNGFNIGKSIEVQKDGQVDAQMDSYFIKLKGNRKYIEEKQNGKNQRIIKGEYQQKNYNLIINLDKLKKYQTQIFIKRKALQIKINTLQNKLQLINKIQQISIFNQLSNFDFLELVYQSQMKIISKGKKTYQLTENQQSENKYLQYVIQGEIKVIILFEKTQYQIDFQSKIGNKMIDKYMNKPKKQTKYSQISTNISKGDWIGLGQYFEAQKFNTKNNYLSFGTVMSVQAKILYIPIQLFYRKFNQMSNNLAWQKLNYLAGIKKNLLDKKIKAQDQKQVDMLKWSQNQLNMSPQLKKKISHYKFDQQRNQIYQLENPEKVGSNFKITDRVQNILKPVPSRVVHMLDNQDNLNLSKINSPEKNQNLKSFRFNKKKQRINLFQQEYDKELIYPAEKKKIQIAEQQKNTNMGLYLMPKTHRKACSQHKNLQNSPFNSTLKNKRFSIAQQYFSLTRKISESFAMNSTFYKNLTEKGDQFCNLNYKTISALENSKKSLMSSRNKFYQKSISNISSEYKTVILPTLNRKKTSNHSFIPMKALNHNINNDNEYESSHKNLFINNNLELLKRKYYNYSNLNLQSMKTIQLSDDKNTKDLNSFHQYNKNQMSQNILIKSQQKQQNKLQEYNKTLFIKKEKKYQKQKQKINLFTNESNLNKNQILKRNLIKTSSILKIQN